MDAKAHAVALCSKYMSHVASGGAHQSHAANVQNVLAGHVEELTRTLRMEQCRADKDEAPSSALSANGGVGSGDWRDHLQRTYSETVIDGSQQDTTLDRRSQARMDAFLESVALALPSEPVSVALVHRSSGTKEPLPSKETRARNGQNIVRRYVYEQMGERDLLARLELYIRAIMRVNASGEDCIAHQEPSGLIKARIGCLLRSFVANVSCVTTVQPALHTLLACAAREMLAVQVADDAVRSFIQNLAAEYEMQTSFASIAFLSSPEQSADSVLAPLLVGFFRFLRRDWKMLVFGSELEVMLASTLPAQLRVTFKDAEFSSLGHLLQTCQQFRSQLEHIELPMNWSEQNVASFQHHSPQAIKQALRDLRRETITVNGRVLPPAHSRKQLIRLLNEALSTGVCSWDGQRDMGTAGSTSDDKGMAGLDSDSYLSSDSDGSPSSPRRKHPNANVSELPAVAQGRSRLERKRFHLRMIDRLTLRLMLASCRTGTGGDAYFIVQDLFGGPGAAVVSHQDADAPRHRGTIEIIVRLASIVIKVHGIYRVFPENGADANMEPLIQLHTTTTEEIGLQEIRSRDDPDLATLTQDTLHEASTLVLQERSTDRPRVRVLSIQPARYQKIKVPRRTR